MENRYKRPKLVCSGSVVFSAYPLYDVATYSQARQGSEYAVLPSGVEDAWIVADDEMLKGSIRFIPVSGSASLIPSQSHYAEWHTFLTNARKKNVVHFYPDLSGSSYIACYLVNPTGEQGISLDDDDSFYKIDLELRSTGSGQFTNY